MTFKAPAALAALAITMAAATAFAPLPGRAQASLAADKAVVDAAKARGDVGEQSDGYIGVRSGADPAVAAAVEHINAGRRQAYASAASSTGVTIEAASAAAARQLIARVPAGQYFRTPEGVWARK